MTLVDQFCAWLDKNIIWRDADDQMPDVPMILAAFQLQKLYVGHSTETTDVKR